MKIAVYYPWIYLRSGIERTILEITGRSHHEYTIFTSRYEPESTYPEYKNLKVVELNRIPVNRSYHNVLYAALKIIFQKLQLEEFDALLVVSEGLGDFITFRNHKIPIICYCFTPLKVIHDKHMRKDYLRKNLCKTPLFFIFSEIFKFFDKLAWRHYSYILSDSNEVKNRILKARLAPSSRIEVLHPGIDSNNIKPLWKYGAYFLQPTRIKWWKNVELAIKSFKKFYENNPAFGNFGLIIAGQVDKASYPYYKDLLRISSSIPNIKIIPNPSQKEYKRLFQNAYTVLHTTPNEDWGMIPIEAMAYGKPVIAVNRGGPTESIIDRETGFLVDSTPREFSNAMAILAKDTNLVRKMGEKARLHSLRYNWDFFIKRLDSYFYSLKDRL